MAKSQQFFLRLVCLLLIECNESLDYFLLQETISIIDDKENKINARLSIRNKEKSIDFNPAQPWQAGVYRLRVAPYLEDPAGNNLERVFDRDITKPADKKIQALMEREFEIKQ